MVVVVYDLDETLLCTHAFTPLLRQVDVDTLSGWSWWQHCLRPGVQEVMHQPHDIIIYTDSSVDTALVRVKAMNVPHLKALVTADAVVDWLDSHQRVRTRNLLTDGKDLKMLEQSVYGEERRMIFFDDRPTDMIKFDPLRHNVYRIQQFIPLDPPPLITIAQELNVELTDELRTECIRHEKSEQGRLKEEQPVVSEDSVKSLFDTISIVRCYYGAPFGSVTSSLMF